MCWTITAIKKKQEGTWLPFTDLFLALSMLACQAIFELTSNYNAEKLHILGTMPCRLLNVYMGVKLGLRHQGRNVN
jgi:hypothetical protein